MLPAPLAPLDPHKTRALTTIYAPRKLRTRPNRTAQTRMIENDVKPTLSPFRPLPDIGQKERTKTKVIVFDLKKEPDKPVRLLNPLTPLRIHGFKQPEKLLRENTFHDKKLRREDTFEEKPHLLRENTYDLLEPVYLDSSSKRTLETYRLDDTEQVSPKTRFKNAAMQVAKLSSLPETGKLLCLRERQTFNLCPNEDKSCRLEQLPQSPVQKLNKLSEIFQNLEMKGRYRDKMKKENSWF
ncbi:uncharacterized protein LOC134648629 [Cydia amplana]|uniref:uncharacterized protein LOC134648629 n=1 Tax=Cydia amplana TaxID=1869771 RepID=UPI002FE5295E